MRSNLLLCLQEAAVIWYTDLLNDVEKTELRSDLHLWCVTLQTWFHKNSAVALRKLSELRYTCQNVQNQIFADVYIAKIICHTMTCSQTEYSILLITWQKINMKMQVHILQFIIVISKQEFIKIMKDQHFNWEFMFMNTQSDHKHDLKLEKTSVKTLYNSHSYY